MASLQGLPDELLLEILQQLPIESFYCITKTCRVFRRLRHDNTLSEFHYDPARRPEPDAKCLSTASIDRYQFDMGIYEPPKEQVPAWRIKRNQWVETDIYSSFRGFISDTVFWPIYDWQQNAQMVPYDLRTEIHFDKDMYKTIHLLLRDTLCWPCYEFRFSPRFRENMQTLMSPVRCEGCGIYHPRIHFGGLDYLDKSVRSQPTCVGRTRLFKVCEHVRLNWKEYQKASWSGHFDCKACRTSFRSSSATVTTHIELLKRPHTAFVVDEDTIGLLRSHIGNLKGDVCPHVALNGAEFVDYLLYNIRQCYARDGSWSYSNTTEMPLLDYGGKPWTCRLCRTVASISHTDSPIHGMEHTSQMDLVISRPVVQFSLPSDAAWLAQAERTKDSRPADAHRITWCEDSTCGSSKGGRKEALLIRMLEMAMRIPERHKIYGICPMERSQWLHRVFWWFWSAADRMLSLGEQAEYNTVHLDQPTIVSVVVPNMTNSVERLLFDYERLVLTSPPRAATPCPRTN
ncbi:hypothetical protein PG991_006282 [Apiospora marii]|uniref:F-box domain-containing protein n=1 Tax=Apiospora marii TaxID=335849 RepID=A0ABR1SBJ9_9PEZI